MPGRSKSLSLSIAFSQETPLSRLGHTLWLRPPLALPQILHHRVGRQVARPEQNQPSRMHARAPQVQVLYRRPALRALLMRAQIPHLERMVRPLLDRAPHHVAELVLDV